ncbi:hypothetical protein MMC09_003347 [Bachmanniomyces sp. S44760]|nr:hypothetical protein [Bachmanniomyces sp. S44760]
MSDIQNSQDVLIARQEKRVAKLGEGTISRVVQLRRLVSLLHDRTDTLNRDLTKSIKQIKQLETDHSRQRHRLQDAITYGDPPSAGDKLRLQHAGESIKQVRREMQGHYATLKKFERKTDTWEAVLAADPADRAEGSARTGAFETDFGGFRRRVR